DHHAVNFLRTQTDQRAAAVAEVEVGSCLNEGRSPAFGTRSPLHDSVGVACYNGGMQDEAHLQNIRDPWIPDRNYVLSVIRRLLGQWETCAVVLEGNPY